MPFLASLGIKDAIYAGLIILLGGAAAWYHHHVMVVGENKIIAADNKAVALKEQSNLALNAAAVLANSISEGKYDKIIAAPAVRVSPPLGLCRPAFSSGAGAGAAAGNKGGTDASTGGSADAGVAQTLSDFATDAVKIAVDSDAQVTALQEEIAHFRAEMR